MYGYIRPVKGELKVSEYERYRGVYCGLCHRLRRRYGPLARFLVNYDFAFLAMLLSKGEPAERTVKCPYHPLKRGLSCPMNGAAMDTAADQTVILAWWKLADGIADSGFLKALLYKFLCLLFHGAYRKAAVRQPRFSQVVSSQLKALSSLETEKCDRPDAAADCFASILRAVSDGEENPQRQRILGEFLYHLGRIVYFLDARDDLSDDLKTGNYNPFIYRFEVTDKLSDRDEEEIRRSMQHSHNALSSAFSLLDENIYTPILSNILYLGIPSVTASVFSGQWRSGKKQQTERSRL